jgi:hypothetical protein
VPRRPGEVSGLTDAFLAPFGCVEVQATFSSSTRRFRRTAGRFIKRFATASENLQKLTLLILSIHGIDSHPFSATEHRLAR